MQAYCVFLNCFRSAELDPWALDALMSHSTNARLVRCWSERGTPSELGDCGSLRNRSAVSSSLVWVEMSEFFRTLSSWNRVLERGCHHQQSPVDNEVESESKRYSSRRKKSSLLQLEGCWLFHRFAWLHNFVCPISESEEEQLPCPVRRFDNFEFIGQVFFLKEPQWKETSRWVQKIQQKVSRCVNLLMLSSLGFRIRS